ncbi:MAG: S8 family serine peptidase [Bacteroidia bacterium]
MACLRRLSLSWLGLSGLLAQSFYVEVSETAEPLQRQLRQWAQGARQAPLWPGLARVEAFPSTSPLRQWYVVHFENLSAAAAEAHLRATPGIQQVERVTRRRLCSTPLLGWHHQALQTAQVWGFTPGHRRIPIACLDSGVEWQLPAFRSQLWINSAEDLNRNGTLDSGDLDGQDNDGNGFADDVIGYDFTDQPFSSEGGDVTTPDPLPTDEHGHGTAIASVIGARPDLSPVAGLAYGCPLMVLRCFSASGYGEDDDIARAILYAVQNGARVINCSFGDTRPSRLLQAAIQYAVRQGVVVVAASGNGTGRQPHFPSGFPEVISAGGLAYEENSGSFYLWPFSGYFRVDWLAPADRIPVLTPTGEVRLLSGTSLAAALSSAAVGLILSWHDFLSPEDVRATLRAHAVPLSGGWSLTTGQGRLRLLPAFTYPQSGQGGWLYPPDGSVILRSVPLVFATYHSLLEAWEVSISTRPEGPWQILQQGNQALAAETLETWPLPPPGPLYLRLRLHLRNGTDLIYLRTLRYLPSPQLNPEIRSFPAWQNGLYGSLLEWRLPFPIASCARLGPTWSCPDKVDSVAGAWIPYSTAPNHSADIALFALPDTLTYPCAYAPPTPQTLPYCAWMPTGLTAPIGFYYPHPAPDWNQDGKPDLIVSQIDLRTGRPTQLAFLKLENSRYKPYDSFPNAALLPRDIKDWDGDGQPELLGVWLDTFYVLGGSPPKQLLWKGRGRAAALVPHRKVWVRTPSGHYERLSPNGLTDLRLLDTVRWEGSTSIPRLLTLNLAGDTFYAFGNYAGWVFLYTARGTLRWAFYTGLWDVGSHLMALDTDEDGQPELAYLGQNPSGQWWELGTLQLPEGRPLTQVGFWVGSGGVGRAFHQGRRLILWLPPYLYDGEFQNGQWKGRSWDATSREVFGVWLMDGTPHYLLGTDSLPTFYRLNLPTKAPPSWAYPGGLSASAVLLRWHPTQTGATYRLYRSSSNADPHLIYEGRDTSFLDLEVQPTHTYLYAVQEVGGALSPPFLVRPGPRPCLDSVWLAAEGLIRASGNSWWNDESPHFFTLLPSGTSPLQVLCSGNQWLLLAANTKPLESLYVDTLLRDVYGMFLSPSCRRQAIHGSVAVEPCPRPVRWEISDERTVEVYFEGVLPPAAYEVRTYEVLPQGAVERLERLSDGLRFFLSTSVQRHPIILRWRWAPSTCPNQVAFSPAELAHQNWGFFPNPLPPTEANLFFWGLRPGTQVKILTPDGHLCATFQISEPELPTSWNLQTLAGRRLAPGVYLIIAEHKEGWRAWDKLYVE